MARNSGRRARLLNQADDSIYGLAGGDPEESLGSSIQNHAGGGKPNDHPDPALQAALNVPRLTLSAIARRLGVTRDAVESWRRGRRRPKTRSRDRLADLLLSHAREVTAVATRLKLPAMQPRIRKPAHDRQGSPK
jgi:transposase-like protein